jgi:U3 small nucleolar RNA-associated protein 18
MIHTIHTYSTYLHSTKVHSYIPIHIHSSNNLLSLGPTTFSKVKSSIEAFLAQHSICETNHVRARLLENDSTASSSARPVVSMELPEVSILNTNKCYVWNDPDDSGQSELVVEHELLSCPCSLHEYDTHGDAPVEHQDVDKMTGWAELSHSAQLNIIESTEPDRAPHGLTRMLREGGALIEDHAAAESASCKALPLDLLQMTRLPDANTTEPSKSVIRSVQFHPNRSLLLTAGLDKSLRLFDIDGIYNPKVRGLFFEDLPIRQASFCRDGDRVVVTGRRSYFYQFCLQSGNVERVAPLLSGGGQSGQSLETFVESPDGASQSTLAFLGADGSIPLVSLKHQCCTGIIKMSGSARAASFSADGTMLLTAGGDGIVFVWDLRKHNRCVERIVDRGALDISSLTISHSRGHMGVGLGSGVVNIYDGESSSWFKRQLDEPRVVKSDSRETEFKAQKQPFPLMNLKTTINRMTFNPDGQILAVSSCIQRDALRLVHVPSRTVFSNWPSSKTPLHYVWSTSFSSTGGYFAVGNARGHALLYRLHAYDV